MGGRHTRDVVVPCPASGKHERPRLLQRLILVSGVEARGPDDVGEVEAHSHDAGGLCPHVGCDEDVAVLRRVHRTGRLGKGCTGHHKGQAGDGNDGNAQGRSGDRHGSSTVGKGDRGHAIGRGMRMVLRTVTVGDRHGYLGCGLAGLH